MMFNTMISTITAILMIWGVVGLTCALLIILNGIKHGYAIVLGDILYCTGMIVFGPISIILVVLQYTQGVHGFIEVLNIIVYKPNKGK